MTPTSGDENPYQPPKAELLTQSHVVPQKMPSSIKWALAYSVAMLVGWILTTGRYALSNGILEMFDGWADAILTVAELLCRLGLFIGLTVGLKRRWGFRLASSMIITTASSSMIGFIRFALFRDGQFQLMEAVIGGVCYYGIFRLFHRFTFGLPSRRYYGMIRDEPPASETRSSET